MEKKSIFFKMKQADEKVGKKVQAKSQPFIKPNMKKTTMFETPENKDCPGMGD